MLAVFKKAGTFKGKKVAIFYGADSDAPEVKVVQDSLKKLGIPVGLTAEDSAQATDAVASDQETQSIAQRFQSAGVNVVIGVGGSRSMTWPRAQLDNQSTYKPTYIATSESSHISYVESTKGANPYLKYVLSASLRRPFTRSGRTRPSKSAGRGQEGLPVGQGHASRQSHQSRRRRHHGHDL